MYRMTNLLKCYLGVNVDADYDGNCVAVFAHNYKEARNILHKYIADDLTFGEYILSIGKAPNKQFHITRQRHIVVPDGSFAWLCDDDWCLENQVYHCLYDTFTCPVCKTSADTKYRDDNEKTIACVHCNTY